MPSDFKSKFASLLESTTSEKITFSQYSATIKTQNGLIIIFPNQWFFIASYFVPFTIELKRYKDIFNSIFKDLNKSQDITKQLKESKIIPDDIDKLINQYFDQELDKIYFKKFITDYSWWFGSKYINRSDFYISSILNLANVVNDSQGYIAELTNKLTESEELYNILKVLAKKQLSKREDLLTDIILYETESIRDFALFVFEKFYSKNWSSVLGNSEIKIAKINSLEFNSYDFIDFKRVIAEFDYELSKEELSSSGTLRYFEKPLLVLNDRYFYFSTQWNGDDQRDLSFKNLKKYFEYNFNSYKLIKLNNSYQLLKVSNFNDKFLNNVNNSGLNFDINIINRFIASLCSKPFLILSGLSGSGKTKLAQSFAIWISETKGQYLLVPVGADWTNREPLLGYPNSLEKNKYVTPDSGVLGLIQSAIKNPLKPYFLILDEMNLSHVERYFADFLSAMESKDDIKLHSSIDLYSKIEENGDFNEEYKVHENILLPSNLFIIGTVNIDETTYMFSPKVLDRANTIEFRLDKTDLSNFYDNPTPLNLNNLHIEENIDLPGVGSKFSDKFMEMATAGNQALDFTDISGILISFFERLKVAGAEFGYRTSSEIAKLVFCLKSFGSDIDEAIDFSVMQKLLPKLHGSRSKMVRILPILAHLCLNNKSTVDAKSLLDNYYNGLVNITDKDVKVQIKYPVSFEKICRMYKNALDNGFTSYAEA